MLSQLLLVIKVETSLEKKLDIMCLCVFTFKSLFEGCWCFSWVLSVTEGLQYKMNIYLKISGWRRWAHFCISMSPWKSKHPSRITVDIPYYEIDLHQGLCHWWYFVYLVFKSLFLSQRLLENRPKAYVHNSNGMKLNCAVLVKIIYFLKEKCNSHQIQSLRIKKRLHVTLWDI